MSVRSSTEASYFFLFSKAPSLATWPNSYQALSSGINWPKREADCLPYLVPKLEVGGATPLLPLMPS